MLAHPHGLPRRELQRFRARRACPALHEPRLARVRAGGPAGDGEGGAVRPLLALPGHAAAAVPGRVRRRLDRPGAAVRRRRGRARGQALRAHLPGLRRRLGGPAGRRAHRVRVRVERDDQAAPARAAGLLPRAVHALHPVRRPDGGHRRLPLLAQPRARPRVRAGHGPAVRHLLAHAARRSRRGPRTGSRAATARTRRRTRARSAPRRWTCCAACCPPRRCRTWASSPAARPTSR